MKKKKEKEIEDELWQEIEELQFNLWMGPSFERPCRRCIHSHYREGSPMNNCDTEECRFVPRIGWKKYFEKEKEREKI